MSEEEEEAKEAARTQIRSKVAEIAARHEAIWKTQVEKDSIVQDIREKKEDVAKVEEKVSHYKKEKHDAERAENQKEVEERNRSEFRHEKIKERLERRIPRLAAVPEADAGGTTEDKTDGKDAVDKANQQPDSKDKQKDVHKYVLVSYVNMGSNQDDYQVTYRIDKSITVQMLHRDACAYWGCSHNKYVLCKLEYNKADVKAVPLWSTSSTTDQSSTGKRDEDHRNTKVQDQHVLSNMERAHLFLVNEEDLKKFEIEGAKNRDAKLLTQDSQAQKKDNDPATIQTLRHGGVTSTKVAEPWVEALRAWPGMYNLLKNRDRVRERKWARSRCADFVILGLLTAFSASILSLRLGELDVFSLKEGVAEALGTGIAGEMYPGASTVPFKEIKTSPDAWLWLNNNLHYQLWNGNSTLRRFYTPLGEVRLRQQRAGLVECASREVPVSMQSPCYQLKVSELTQETASLIPKDVTALESYNNRTSGAVWEPYMLPFEWQAPANPRSILYGRMADYSDGGYAAVFSLSESISHAAWMNDMDFLKEAWVDSRTRLLVVELTLANLHIGGFLSASFLIEFSASGTVEASMELLHFNPYNSSAVEAANILDWIRCVITLLWVGLIRLYYKTRERLLEQNRWSFSYLFSFSGLIDSITVGMTVALKYMRTKGPFPDPMLMTRFYSYAYLGNATEMCNILEACLLLVLIVKFTTLLRFNPTIFRFFKLFTRSIRMFVSFCFLFVPLLFGSAFAAHTIWSPYILAFSSWSQSLSQILLGTYQPFAHALRMEETGRGWGIPFLIYFFLSTKVFAVHTFLAITVQAYFEVELVDAADPSKERWSPDQYLDWALWPSVLKKLTGKTPGASRQDGFAEAEEAEDSGSGSSSDEEGK